MDSPPQTSPKPTEKKLLDVVRDTIRRKHYSVRIEEAYIYAPQRGRLAVRSPFDC